MLTLRRAEQRSHGRSEQQQIWLTFYPSDEADLFAAGFGSLEILDEHVLPPRAKLPTHRSHAAGVLTYVMEGVLGCVSSTGATAKIQAGEFHYAAVSAETRVGASNPSMIDWSHVVQLWFRTTGAESRDAQRRFSAAERRGALCLVASSDGRSASLATNEDISVYSALLDSEHAVVHEIAVGRRVWVHVLYGRANVAGRVLTTGDGLGVFGERCVHINAIETTELLLVDIAAPLESPALSP